MDYESLSSIVIVVILGIVVIGWLPRRTVDGMKRVIEHREDRFSSSLHLVDETSGTRFSDTHDLAMKGVVMQRTPSQESAEHRRHVEHVRRLRRAAARRRRILVLSLLGITLLTLAAALVWRFPVWYVLIPAAALLTVVGLGIRASRQALRWEREVAGRRAGVPRPSARELTRERGRVDATNHEPAADGQAATGVMEQREIRRALKQSRDERDRALAQRRGTRADDRDGSRPRSDAQPPHEEPVVRSAPASDAPRVDEPSDATNELDAVHAAHALEAFDMATEQDLISFSLDASADPAGVGATGPESLEIKSTRQVAKARPVPEPTAVPESASGSKARAPQEPKVHSSPVQMLHTSKVQEPQAQTSQTAKDSHAAETSDVAAPEPTSDSLGADLQAVLARRAS